MGDNSLLNIEVPNFLRPNIAEVDIPRFLKIHHQTKHTRYDKTMALLLDVYDQVAEGDKIEETFLLINQFLRNLKKINPALHKKFKEELKNG